MVEDWIDTLTATWGTVNPNPGTSGAFGQQRVRSFNLVTDNDYPEAIVPNDLKDSPLAITWAPALRPRYSRGGPRTAMWYGETEFHLLPGFDKRSMRQVLPWYKAIWQAAALTPQLGGKVELWMISDEDDGISKPVGLQYGDEAVHWGLIVKWWVKEHVETQITVGGPGT